MSLPGAMDETGEVPVPCGAVTLRYIGEPSGMNVPGREVRCNDGYAALYMLSQSEDWVVVEPDEESPNAEL